MGIGDQIASRKGLIMVVIGTVIILGLTIAVIVLALDTDEVNYQLLDIKIDIPAGPDQHMPVVHGGVYPLEELLHSVKMNKSDTFIIYFETTTGETAQATINMLNSVAYDKPVVFSVPVLNESGFDIIRFQKLLHDLTLDIPVAINLDLSAVCCDEGIGSGTVEYIASLIEASNDTTTVGVNAAVLLKSWTKLKWLLNKVIDSKLIISANSVYKNSTVYDILLARNDVEKDRVFYNLEDDLYTEFTTVASTAGSPLIYFNIKPRDAGKLIWSHNTDTWELIHKATSGDTMMVEADIRLDPATNTTIMAHDKGDNNNVTFEQWLKEVIKVDKGMKLDFKELQAVVPALKLVTKYRSQIKGPIWSNADVLLGPGDRHVTINADQFLKAAQVFPAVTLSLGWTTVQKGSNYSLQFTMSHVKQMHVLCKDLVQPVTFPVRAEQALDSWQAFDWLLKQSRKYTLTVWTGHGDNVTKANMDDFKRKFEMSRVYFDLPKELRPTIP